MKMKKICAALLFVFAAIIAGNLLYRTVFAENAVLTLSAEMTLVPDYEGEVLAVTASFSGSSAGAVSGKMMYDSANVRFLSAEGYGEEGFQFTAEDDGQAVRFVWGDAAEAGDGSSLMVFYFRPGALTGEYAFSLAEEALTACRAENGKVVYFKLTPGEPIAGTFEVTRGAIRGIRLAETEISVVYGETREFPQVTYEPEGTSDEKTVLWSSSDEAVLGAAEGQMRGLNPGKAVLTAAVPGRDVSAEAGVRVLFSDVTDPEAWYFDSVYWALDNGVTSGYGKGTFQPTAHLTRAQVVGFLYNMAGRPDVSGLPGVSFTDVGENDWYYSAVRWAVANGITSGYGQGTFRPDANCTRAMIVTFLMNYARSAGMYAEPETAADFSDVPADAWYKAGVDWAAANGITSGYGEGTFSPDVTCTRAMMVTFLRKTAELQNID